MADEYPKKVGHGDTVVVRLPQPCMNRRGFLGVVSTLATGPFLTKDYLGATVAPCVAAPKMPPIGTRVIDPDGCDYLFLEAMTAARLGSVVECCGHPQYPSGHTWHGIAQADVIAGTHAWFQVGGPMERRKDF